MVVAIWISQDAVGLKYIWFSRRASDFLVLSFDFPFTSSQHLLRYFTEEAKDKAPLLPFDASEWRLEVVKNVPRQRNGCADRVLRRHCVVSCRHPSFSRRQVFPTSYLRIFLRLACANAYNN